jgi:S1-C subfamily serine protease
MNDMILFNIHQNKKLQYLNLQKMLQEGREIFNPLLWKTMETYLGISLNNADEKNVNNSVDRKGVYIDEVDDKSPAYLFGIKKNDYILNIDGFEMNNPTQVIQYLQSIHPYDWVTIHIRRGKKEIDKVIELTYTYKDDKKLTFK